MTKRVIILFVALLLTGCYARPCTEQNKANFIADLDNIIIKLKNSILADGNNRNQIIASFKEYRFQAANLDAPNCGIYIKNLFVKMLDETVLAMESKSQVVPASVDQFDPAYKIFKNTSINQLDNSPKLNTTNLSIIIIGLGIFIIALLASGILSIARSRKIKEVTTPNEPALSSEPIFQTPLAVNPSAPIPQPVNQPIINDREFKPKNRGLLDRPIDWIALAFLIIMAAFLISYLFGSNGTEVTQSIMANPSHRITYRINGSGPANVTYFNATGGMEQHDVNLPFQTEFMMDRYQPVSIVAQKHREAGTITCEILDNGKPWLNSNTSAAYGLVTCAGWIH